MSDPSAPDPSTEPEAGGFQARMRSGLHDFARRLPISPKNAAEAVAACHLLHAHGFATTIGHISTRGDSPDHIRAESRAVIDGIAADHENRDFYLSVKPPAIEFAMDHAENIAARCIDNGMGVLFDAHEHAQQDQTLQLLARLMDVVPAGGSDTRGWTYGVVLPSRWRRSLDDATWVAEAAVRPRIVKGEFSAGKAADEADPRQGFLELIDLLADTVPEIGVATHDQQLAELAIGRAAQVGANVQLELLLGLPCGGMLDLAARTDTPVRFYVPYSDILLLHGVRQYLKEPHKLARGNPFELVGRMDTKLHRITAHRPTGAAAQSAPAASRSPVTSDRRARPSLSTEVVRDREALRSLQAEWEQLAPTAAVEPWRSFEWADAAAEACSSDDAFRLTIVRRRGELVAVAPMVVKRSTQPLRPRRVEFLGAEELKEPNGFIAADDEALGALLDAVADDRRHALRLSRLLPDEGDLDAILAKLRAAGWVTATRSLPYPVLDLDGTPIRKSMRQDLRRARRKAEALGAVHCELAEAADASELRAQLHQAFRIEASGWKAAAGTEILSNPARRAFFEHYGRAMSERDQLRLHFLTIDDVPVASQYGVASGGQFWLLNIGYDESYRSCSPGNLLLEQSILTAQSHGLHRYHLLGKAESWTERWTKETRDTMIVAAYRPSPRSIRSLLSDALYVRSNATLASSDRPIEQAR